MAVDASFSYKTKTSVDYMAQGYWQEFLAKRPVAGGLSYEAQLQECQLDDSLASLQRVDTLLSKIRRDSLKDASNTLSGSVNAITTATYTSEQRLLSEDKFRNLLLFLAFYAGRVLAAQWDSRPHWYSQTELQRYYPQLPLSEDDFYQQIAVEYLEASPADDTDLASKLFFALEPIGLRLFGHIDRQFVAAQGGSVASGLYQAVKDRSPAVTNHLISQAEITNDSLVAIEQASSIGTEEANNHLALSSSTKGANNTTTASVLNRELLVAEQEELVIDNTSKNTIKPVITNKKAQPTPELFTRLLTELDEIEVPQSAGVEEYQQARKTLDQFERHIARQGKPRSQVVFSDTHHAARKQALLLLKKSADAGNTAAMLRLAMYELLEESTGCQKVTDNDDTTQQAVGVSLVKQAATAKDSRAQRLLSQLFYQGLEMPQDIAMGRYWLEQAAQNGHPEAIALNKEWQQAQSLIDTQKQEQDSFKRYQLLIGVIVVVAILLIIFV